MPLRGHDIERGPEVRAKVRRTSPHHWYWSYEYDYGDGPKVSVLKHGPFGSQPEAYASAKRMVEAL
jgi:hypothetical protein